MCFLLVELWRLINLSQRQMTFSLLYITWLTDVHRGNLQQIQQVKENFILSYMSNNMAPIKQKILLPLLNKNDVCEADLQSMTKNIAKN